MSSNDPETTHKGPVDPILQPVLGSLQQFGEAARRRVSSSILSIIEALLPLAEQALKGQPERREALSYLAQRSWYPSLSMPAFGPPLYELVRHRRTAALDEHMAAFAETNLAEFVGHAMATFPDRAPFFRDALWAHRRRRYRLSIPVLLTQADGISEEILGVGLYQRRGSGLATTDAVVGYLPTGTLTAWVVTQLSPLQSPSGLHRPAGSAGDIPPGSLSRHAVMHGVDLDYGTRINSLRAFMVVAYLSELPDLLTRAAELRRFGTASRPSAT